MWQFLYTQYFSDGLVPKKNHIQPSLQVQYLGRIIYDILIYKLS